MERGNKTLYRRPEYELWERGCILTGHFLNISFDKLFGLEEHRSVKNQFLKMQSASFVEIGCPLLAVQESAASTIGGHDCRV